MRLRVHADDLGVSRGVTDAIVRCIDHGAVRSVSVIANGAAFEHAMEALRARPHVAVSVHLNAMEGVALTTGRPLRLTFGGLLANAGKHAAMLRAEWAAQVQRVRAALPERPLRLDSHGHVHHLPGVFPIVRELCAANGAAMRLVREPAVFVPSPSGVVKHVLLNALSARARPLLRDVAVDDWFVGVIATGRMSAEIVDAALAKISREASVEILFHPGRAAAGEEGIWEDQPHLREYYFSEARAREARVVCGPELERVIDRYS